MRNGEAKGITLVRLLHMEGNMRGAEEPPSHLSTVSTVNKAFLLQKIGPICYFQLQTASDLKNVDVLIICRNYKTSQMCGLCVCLHKLALINPQIIKSLI